MTTGVATADSHGSGHHFADALGHVHHRVAKAVQLHDDMRELMEDHIVWTRSVIVSVAHDLPNFGTEAGRLLQNQDDIGDLFAQYYGRRFGDRLTDLLHEHILIAAELLTAAKAGDEVAVGEAAAAWYANGEDIADLLSAVNRRNWSRTETREMLVMHLDTTLAEAVARLTGDMDADIAAYDEVHAHMLHMADFLSNGILRQFAFRFR
jgi:hypothetical protein